MKQKSFSFISVGIFIILMITIVGLSQSLVHIIGRQNLLKTQKKNLITIQEQTETLRKKLQDVNTPAFIEREAREKLNMTKDGETVILIDKTGQITEEQKKEWQPSSHWNLWWDLFFE